MGEEFHYSITTQDLAEMITAYLIPDFDQDLALVVSIYDYDFTPNITRIDAIAYDHLDRVLNLTHEGYHVFWLVNEYVNKENLQWVIEKMNQYQDLSTTISVSLTGHTIKDTPVDLVNTTQALALVNGRLLTDESLRTLFSPWISTNQLFIINTCYGEGLAYELQQNGRMIITSTTIDQSEAVPIFDTNSRFHEVLMNTWNSSISIEANYLNIWRALRNILSPVLFDYDEEQEHFL